MYQTIPPRMQILNNKLLDEVFVITGLIKVKVGVISLNLETMIILDITKTKSNCFIDLSLYIALKKITRNTIAHNTIRHCFWKSCIVHTTYRLVRYLLVDNLPNL